MSYIKLNGREFDADIAISAYNRNFNVLDGDNAGRVLSGLMLSLIHISEPTRH